MSGPGARRGRLDREVRLDRLEVTPSGRYSREEAAVQIRKDQMAVLSEAMRASFEERLLDHVERCWPEEVWHLPLAALRHRLRRTVDRASAFGIRREVDVVAFVDLTFEHGDAFDSEPRFAWVRPILQSRELDGAAKVSRIRVTIDPLGGGGAVAR